MNGGAATVLVVDDEAVNLRLLDALLAPEGYTVLCARSGGEALALAAAHAPDLIVLDVMMPAMDGLAATRLLRRDPVTAAIPVIALTALAMKEDQERSFAAGCDGYIAKPLRYQQLYALIDSVLAAAAHGVAP